MVAGVMIVVISLILTRVPVLGDILRTFNILIHEFGHAVGTKLMFGKVNRIEIYPVVAGVTHSELRKGMAINFTTLMGYPFASVFSLWLVNLVAKEEYELVFNIVLVIAVISLILWIRNGYGAVWTTVFIGVTYFVKVTIGGTFSEIYITFLVAILFVEAAFAAIVIIHLYSNNEEVIDAEVLAESTGIPAWFWVFTFVAVSVTVFLKGVGVWYGI